MVSREEREECPRPGVTAEVFSRPQGKPSGEEKSRENWVDCWDLCSKHGPFLNSPSFLCSHSRELVKYEIHKFIKYLD